MTTKNLQARIDDLQNCDHQSLQELMLCDKGCTLWILLVCDGINGTRIKYGQFN